MAEEEATSPEEPANETDAEEASEAAEAAEAAAQSDDGDVGADAEADGQPAEGDDASPQGEGEETTDVAEAELPHGVSPGADVRGGQVDILLDTTMPVEIRLGDVEMEVRDLLKVGPGSIVTVDKLVGEPLDLYLKGIRFATGQLIVAGDTLGVRIIEILPRRKSDRGQGGTTAAAAVAAAQQQGAA
jgi:flagellar motor switch protein FliN/FliY